MFLARLFMLTADIIASIRTAHGHHSAWAEYRGGR